MTKQEMPHVSNNRTGKVAFITGANKGIGIETAGGLGKLGIAVVIGSRDEARGHGAADKLRSVGAESVEAVRFDVSDVIRQAGGRNSDYLGVQLAEGW